LNWFITNTIVPAALVPPSAAAKSAVIGKRSNVLFVGVTA